MSVRDLDRSGLTRRKPKPCCRLAIATERRSGALFELGVVYDKGRRITLPTRLSALGSLESPGMLNRWLFNTNKLYGSK